MIPDRIGEVEAWRAWTVIEPRSLHPRLRSANADKRQGIGLENAIWSPDRWTYAICPSGGHVLGEVPMPGCSCGMYAAKSLDQLLTYGYAQFQPDGVTVIGKVGFAGKVIEGSQGYKAARGRVLRLYVPLSLHAVGAKLADAYHVPFELVPWWATDPRLCKAS